MDIRSGSKAGALSNFQPRPFSLDGVQISSMEGFLQSLKYKEPEMQAFVCTLVGKAAKFKGKKKKWWRTQTLWWRGVEIDRHSVEYQTLLDRAFEALAKNTAFLRALKNTGTSTLSHTIGKGDKKRTVLTEREFVSRLMEIRERVHGQTR